MTSDPDKIDRLLIKEVHRNECLYNKKMKEYRDVPLKQNIWYQIARKLNTTGKSFISHVLYVYSFSRIPENNYFPFFF